MSQRFLAWMAAAILVAAWAWPAATPARIHRRMRGSFHLSRRRLGEVAAMTLALVIGAGFGAGKGTLVQQKNGASGGGEVEGSGAAGGAGADDQGVDLKHRA